MTEEKRRKLLSLFWEFFRYAVVGGIAFLADYGTLFLFQELILTGGTPWELFISTAAGFIVGVRELRAFATFVFRRKTTAAAVRAWRHSDFHRGRRDRTGLTELIMYLGTELLHISYLIVKIAAAAIVLVWNYVGRKVLIFDRKGKIETK